MSRLDVGTLIVDEDRLRGTRRDAVRQVCSSATNATDAAYLLEVLGLAAAEGKANVSVTLDHATVQAVAQTTRVGRGFNDPGGQNGRRVTRNAR